MPTAAILVVGDEILEGHTQDSNSHYLAKRLAARGVRVGRIVACSDDVDDISAQLERLVRDGFSYVFVTGGIGPTPDDRTYEAVGMAAGVPVVVTPQDEAWLRSRSAQRDYASELWSDSGPAEPLRRMVRRPEGSSPILNPVGMALGSVVRVASSTVFVLPGVPREMKAMMEQQVEPNHLAAPIDAGTVAEIEWVGQEARLFDLMREAEGRHAGVRIGSYPQDDKGRVVMRIQGPAALVEAATATILKALASARRIR